MREREQKRERERTAMQQGKTIIFIMIIIFLAGYAHS